MYASLCVTMAFQIWHPILFTSTLFPLLHSLIFTNSSRVLKKVGIVKPTQSGENSSSWFSVLMRLLRAEPGPHVSITHSTELHPLTVNVLTKTRMLETLCHPDPQASVSCHANLLSTVEQWLGENCVPCLRFLRWKSHWDLGGGGAHL